MKRGCIACAIATATLCAPSRAIDLGVIGPTYPIAEPHLLQEIERRLREKERSGELQRLIDEARARGVQSVRDPAAIELRPTTAARTFYYDPSFTLDRNVVDASGRLMFPAGTRKNPLEVVSLGRRLLFFDARDPRQLSHARRLIGNDAGRIKPVLTGGSYLDLMKSWRIPVYYDQAGLLTRRLGIRHVPALVSQDGLRLRIDEVAL